MLDSIWLQIIATSWIEWLGTVAGVVGVYLSIKEKTIAWMLFIVCYSAYVYLSFEAGLFAALLMNSIFIVISIYGWLSWTESTKVVDTVSQIGHLPRSLLYRVILFVGTVTVTLGWVLNTYTEAFLPYLDAFATSCAFTAQWMLSRKYIENWICWICADTVYIYLWGLQGYYVSVGLFTIFIILAIKGWIEWRHTIRTRESASLQT